MEVSDRYRKLSMLQSAAIMLAAISVFDMGFSGTISRGIGFNYLIFHVESYPDFVLHCPFWGEFQLWAYCFLIVCVCQILKVYTIDDRQLYLIVRLCGVTALISFVTLHLLALVLVIKRFDFRSEAFSSLVDYGKGPALLSVWSMVIPGLTAPVYLTHVSAKLQMTLARTVATVSSMVAGLMMASIGVTLENNVVDHGVFVQPMFFAFAIVILLHSIDRKSVLISGSGYVALVIYVLLSLLPVISIFLAELIVGGLFSGWFLLFGVDVHWSRNEVMGQNKPI